MSGFQKRLLGANSAKPDINRTSVRSQCQYLFLVQLASLKPFSIRFAYKKLYFCPTLRGASDPIPTLQRLQAELTSTNYLNFAYKDYF